MESIPLLMNFKDWDLSLFDKNIMYEIEVTGPTLSLVQWKPVLFTF